jgi:vacuolar iron transporter family protein
MTSVTRSAWKMRTEESRVSLKENVMPQTPHIERHFTAGETVRDIVIGMSDGLTVPFALAAGLSGAVSSTTIIITAGLAEIAAGSIAMGLGGYLAARSDAEHYASERVREQQEIQEKTGAEKAEVMDVFTSYGLNEVESAPIVEALSRRPDAWIDFMMRFELGLEKPDPKRALTSALTIAASYIVGGLIPLSPYFFLAPVSTALLFSVMATLLALLLFGYVKGRFTGARPLRSALQTALIGGLAAAAAFLIARLISS